MKMPKFFTNSHLNTILPIYLTQNIEPNYVRERLKTPDHDFLDLDWVNHHVTDQPTLILFHGAEGSSKSHYAKRIMYYIEKLGWRGVVPHFRGCSGHINHNLRFYHAGDTEDIAWVIKIIKERTPDVLFASGVSLGGNALLKYLGETPNNDIKAAIAISVPFDLVKCVDALDKGFNKYVYAKSFLNSLLPKMKAYSQKFTNFTYIDRKIDTLDEFNNMYLCQLFNFKDSNDYYQQSSSRPFLKLIETPTLILQSRNDPMIPVSAWPERHELSPAIRFVATKGGGHVGFITNNRNYKDALLKLPKFMVQYLKIFM